MAEEEKPQGEGAEERAYRLRAGVIINDDEDLWNKLDAMTEEERIAILDPICKAIGEAIESQPRENGYALPNRLLALAVLELYEQWNHEVMSRG